MSIIKRILCAVAATLLLISLASCDELGEELLEEFVIYLEDLADVSADANLEANTSFAETENNNFWNDDFWNDDDNDDFGDDTVDSETAENPYVHEHSMTLLEEVPPSCTEDGLTEGWWCDECGEIFSEQTIIPAMGHTMDTWIIDCYADWDIVGIKHADCLTCDETITEEMIPSEGLYYTPNGDGTLCVKGLGKCTDTDIVVPMTYNGMQVTSVGNSAFSSNRDIKSVVLPSGITKIGSSAFAWAENMEYVNIPETVTEIGDSAFWYCFKITSLNIPQGVTYIGDGAFGCTGMDSSADLSLEIGNRHYAKIEGCLIELSTGILMVGFNDSQIPDNGTVTAIANNAFAGCGDLKEIVIPGSVESIGASAFYCCGNLESITFSEGLIKIGYNAFNACGSLTSIVFPNSLIEISDYAFTWCSGIEYVVIGTGITNIYSGTFNQCSSLKDVYYTGTEEEWQKIDVADDWISGDSGYTVHYNYVR